MHTYVQYVNKNNIRFSDISTKNLNNVITLLITLLLNLLSMSSSCSPAIILVCPQLQLPNNNQSDYSHYDVYHKDTHYP